MAVELTEDFGRDLPIKTTNTRWLASLGFFTHYHKGPIAVRLAATPQLGAAPGTQASQLSAPRAQPAAGASRSSRDGASLPERKDIAGSCQRR